MSWTDEQKLQIEQVCVDIAEALHNSGTNVEICASALMTTMARLCVLSLESDEHMINEFRRSLIANRQALQKDPLAS